MVSDELLPVLGHYRLISQIGEGGMATVFRGMRSGLDEEVAVKVLQDFVSLQETARQRFIRETFTLATLDHPHIVRVSDFGEEDGRLYYVMPLLPGGTLLSRIETGPLSPGDLIPLCEDLLEALRYLHGRGLFHRDLTPGNVMFDRDGRLVLMDFGLVKPERGSSLTRTGRILGTPRYIPPETLKDGHFDELSDLFQAGTVMYQAATGKLPYREETLLDMILDEGGQVPSPESPGAVNAAINEGLSNFLLNGVEWRRERRYSDATSMLEDLGRVKQGARIDGRRGAFTPSAAMRSLAPGAIGGRYEVTGGGRIASGAEYHEAMDPSGHRVLLKPLPPLLAGEEEALKVLGPYVGIDHPNLGRIRDLIVSGGQPFLVYDHPEGFAALDPPTAKGGLSPERAVRTVLAVNRGLEALHSRGLVHGELALHCVMKGKLGRVRVQGIGVQPLRQAGLLQPPPGDSTARISIWQSPEQHDGREPTPASDVYAGGRLLSLLLHGKLLPPGVADSEESARDPLMLLVDRATSTDPGRRPVDATDFSRELLQAVPGAGAARSGPWAGARSALRRSVAVLVPSRDGGGRLGLSWIVAILLGLALAAAILLFL